MGVGSMTVFIEKNGTASKAVPKDECYLLIKYAGAQVFFRPQLFRKPQQVIITSQVDLGFVGEAQSQVPGIEFTQEVSSGVSQKIALRRNIFSLVPATMDSISFKLDLMVDLTNTAATMMTLVNKGLFSPLLTLASPIVDTTVQKVGQIAGELIGAFMGGPDQKRQLVSFQGDFNIVTGETRPGYYAMIGSTDRDYPLPTGAERFTYDGQTLFIDGQPADDYSWVVLEVQTAPVRGERRPSEWSQALDKVRARIRNISANRMATADERRTVYTECLRDLGVVEVLLQADPYYIEGEKEMLIARAYKELDAIQSLPATDAEAEAAATVEADTATWSVPSMKPSVFDWAIGPTRSAKERSRRADAADEYERLLDEYSQVIKEATH